MRWWLALFALWPGGWAMAQALPSYGGGAGPTTFNAGNLNVNGTATFSGSESHSGVASFAQLKAVAPLFVTPGPNNPTTATAHCAVAAGSTDTAGVVTTDATGAGSCDITFGQPFSTFVSCTVVNGNSQATLHGGYITQTLTDVVYHINGTITSGQWNWQCIGY